MIHRSRKCQTSWPGHRFKTERTRLPYVGRRRKETRNVDQHQSRGELLLSDLRWSLGSGRNLGGVEIAPKVWAGRGLPVVPGEHWEKWLGELPFRDIRTGLVLTATAPQPGPGHFINPELKRQVDYLAFGLILQGVPNYRESFLIAGANETGEPDARQFGRARVFYPARDLRPLSVGQPELKRAVFLAEKLKSVDNKGHDWRRLRRAIDALTKGSEEPYLQDERIHQFVRSLGGTDSAGDH